MNLNNQQQSKKHHRQQHKRQYKSFICYHKRLYYFVLLGCIVMFRFPGNEWSRFYNNNCNNSNNSKNTNNYNNSYMYKVQKKDVPWIFGDTCTTHHIQIYYNNRNHQDYNSSKSNILPVVQSRTSDRICGYCSTSSNNGHKEVMNRMKRENQSNFTTTTEHDDENDDEDAVTTLKFASYMFGLSEELRRLKEEECKQLIIFGVAFGDQYVKWLRQEPISKQQQERIKNNQEHVNQLIQTHGKCFVTFVLAESLNITKSTSPKAPTDNNNIEQPQQQQSSSSSSNSTSTFSFKYLYSIDGLQFLIPIYTSDLPYRNMRRNTKIFKLMGPLYIFHWSLRVIWQDAKLIAIDTDTNSYTIRKRQKKKYILPNNYYRYFSQVIELSSIQYPSQVCASFMGLPFHKNTIGSKYINKINKTMQFEPACDAIYEASLRRPTISDNIHTVHEQCIFYQNATSKKGQQQPLDDDDNNHSEQQEQEQMDIFTVNKKLSLNDAMIDSAFIVWDLRTERCQEFIATLSCTWMDEIHCFSDRDQISFAYTFLQMKLQLVSNETINDDNNIIMKSNNIDVVPIAPYNKTVRQDTHISVLDIVKAETHHRLFAYSNTPNEPIVHITKSSCHWYFHGIDDCDFKQMDIPNLTTSMSDRTMKNNEL